MYSKISGVRLLFHKKADFSAQYTALPAGKKTRNLNQAARR